VKVKKKAMISPPIKDKYTFSLYVLKYNLVKLSQYLLQSIIVNKNINDDEILTVI